MIGVLELTEGRGRKPRAERRWLLGLCCLWVEVPVKTGMGERRLRKRVERGADLLLRSGVRRVLTAADFPYWEELRRAGLQAQSLSGSQMKLANAGAVVLPSNAQATRFAQLILDRL